VRSKLTYANAMSSLALFVALGGVSWAAVTLPANSVGKRQIKRNAVTSEDVANGTLRRADFARGALPARGPEGERGLDGFAGENGETGEPGEPGPAGASACDDRLLCPGTDLPAGGAVAITIDAVELARVPAYRASCTTAPACTLALGGPTGASLELDAWYQQAVANPAAATRSFSLTVFDAGGTAVRRFSVSNGVPTDLTHQADRFQLTLSAAAITRIAP
jgi:hypothetical protein